MSYIELCNSKLKELRERRLRDGEEINRIETQMANHARQKLMDRLHKNEREAEKKLAIAPWLFWYPGMVINHQETYHYGTPPDDIWCAHRLTLREVHFQLREYLRELTGNHRVRHDLTWTPGTSLEYTSRDIDGGLQLVQSYCKTPAAAIMQVVQKVEEDVGIPRTRYALGKIRERNAEGQSKTNLPG